MIPNFTKRAIADDRIKQAPVQEKVILARILVHSWHFAPSQFVPAVWHGQGISL
jgi:hypothetical protein